MGVNEESSKKFQYWSQINGPYVQRHVKHPAGDRGRTEGIL